MHFNRKSDDIKDFSPLAAELYQLAIDQWPIPEALDYIVYRPGIPSALAAIHAAAKADKTQTSLWPPTIDGLSKKQRIIFEGVAFFLECSDDAFQNYKSEKEKFKDHFISSVLNMAEIYRPFTTQAGQYDIGLTSINVIDMGQLEWSAAQISTDLRTIYKQAKIRCWGGEVQGEELVKLIKAIRVPELWHELFAHGRLPNIPFDVVSWIADQRNCDLGTALSIVFLLAPLAIKKRPEHKAQIALFERMMRRSKQGFYSNNQLPSHSNCLIANSGEISMEHMLDYHVQSTSRKSDGHAKDLIIRNDMFGILLGVVEHTHHKTALRKAVSALATTPKRGLIGRLFG